MTAVTADGVRDAVSGGSPLRVAALRVGVVAFALITWEIVSRAGLVTHDIVPSLAKIGVALWHLVTGSPFWTNLGITAGEIGLAMVIGGVCGLLVGLVLGANRFLSRAFEALLLYLGPTPKIVFFPVMIMWFGVGGGSKIAMGVVSCLFPIAIATAVGTRGIDRVLIRVGKSFRATPWQMMTRIYLPAMRRPVINGVRLGFGVALIGTLLAETKLSNRGLGYLVIQAYSLFDMPKMYALLILLFVLAIGVNALMGGLDSERHGKR